METTSLDVVSIPLKTTVVVNQSQVTVIVAGSSYSILAVRFGEEPL